MREWVAGNGYGVGFGLHLGCGVLLGVEWLQGTATGCGGGVWDYMVWLRGRVVREYSDGLAVLNHRRIGADAILV